MTCDGFINVPPSFFGVNESWKVYVVSDDCIIFDWQSDASVFK